MEKFIIISLLLVSAVATEAQIKNVIEKNNYARIELEPEFNKDGSREIQILDGYVAGWNSKIVVVASHVSDQSGGKLYIYDYRGNIQNNGSLGLWSTKDAKINVTANSIVITKNGTAHYFDLKGQPK